MNLTLDPQRQYILDILWYCFKNWLNYFDQLDEVVQLSPDWNVFRLTAECFDPAAKRFGSVPPSDVRDVSSGIDNLLRRLTGLIDAIYSPRPSEFDAVFEAYCLDVRGSSVASASKGILEYLRTGEDLSRMYYLSSNLEKNTPGFKEQVVFRIQPGRTTTVTSMPRKDGGESEILLTFAADRFAFGDFVNLPFLFFHEYLSHIHTAKLSAETMLTLTTSPFEDGWLFYAARESYLHALWEGAVPCLGHPSVRAYYLDKMIYTLSSEERQMRFGYDQASRFLGIAEPDLFKEITLIFASTPFDALAPTIPDLHVEFTRTIRLWLRAISVLEHGEREGHLACLKSAASSRSTQEVLSTLLELTEQHRLSGLEEEQARLIDVEYRVGKMKDLAQELGRVVTSARVTGYPVEKLEERDKLFDWIQKQLVMLTDSTGAEIRDLQSRVQAWDNLLPDDPEKVMIAWNVGIQLSTVREEVERASNRVEEIGRDLRAILAAFEHRLDDQSARLDTRISAVENSFNSQIKAVDQRITDYLTKRGLTLEWWQVVLGFIAVILAAIAVYEPIIRLFKSLLGIQ